METLAYLHLACVYAADDTPELRFDFSHWNWQRLQGQIGLRLLAIVVPLTILALAGQAMAASVLQVGDSGPDVTSLQQQLKAAKYFNQTPTGYYGSATEAAVRRFQTEHKLAADGIAGPATWQALQNYSTAYEQRYRTVSYREGLQQGSYGSEVSELQRQLSRLGYPISVDGSFGPQTEQAVRDFQSTHDLPVDGVADSETLASLSRAIGDNEPLPPAASSFGSQVPIPFNNGIDGGKASVGRRYVVVIPTDSGASLFKVQQFVYSARVMPSRLGRFIQAGSFPDRATAETRARKLRGEGLDAQVRYF